MKKPEGCDDNNKTWTLNSVGIPLNVQC